MPEKLERCVSDVKGQGNSEDSAWAICKSSTGETKTRESKIQEKVNANRQVPVFNPPIKKGKIEPNVQKTTKGMGGEERGNQDSVLWKNIFDSQLRRNVKEPKI